MMESQLPGNIKSKPAELESRKASGRGNNGKTSSAELDEDRRREEAEDAEFEAIWGEHGSARIAAANVTIAPVESRPATGTVSGWPSGGSLGIGGSAQDAQGTTLPKNDHNTDNANDAVSANIDESLRNGDNSKAIRAQSALPGVISSYNFDEGHFDSSDNQPRGSETENYRQRTTHSAPERSIIRQAKALSAEQATISSTIFSSQFAAQKVAPQEVDLGTFNAAEYLETYVFPTLLPGIERLLKTVKRKDGQLEEIADPVVWLAQYLVRNNPNTASPNRKALMELADKIDTATAGSRLSSLMPTPLGIERALSNMQLGK
ncbi:hypothetical protein HDU76_009625 [Blyttiomyces sp. JEL0837]|nr:hypothetical protein HDU76_009625 [Blyttiomyces sp. JEL0837]